MAVGGYLIGGPTAAGGVLGGGLLIGTSFYLLGSGSAGLVGADDGGHAAAQTSARIALRRRCSNWLAGTLYSVFSRTL